MKRNLHSDSLRLSDFTGSGSFYPFTITNSVLTEGTKYVAEELGAYWLMEKIDLTVRELVKSTKLFSSELGWFGSRLSTCFSPPTNNCSLLAVSRSPSPVKAISIGSSAVAPCRWYPKWKRKQPTAILGSQTQQYLQL